MAKHPAYDVVNAIPAEIVTQLFPGEDVYIYYRVRMNAASVLIMSRLFSWKITEMAHMPATQQKSIGKHFMRLMKQQGRRVVYYREFLALCSQNSITLPGVQGA